MKISITLFALLGLSYADQTIVGRTPPGPPTKEIKDLILKGIENWGPASNLKPPSSPKPPLREMPFGLGSPKPPHKYPPGKTGVSRIPGSPLGPKKNCRPCKRKRQLCCSGMGNIGRPAQKTSKIRLTKAAGTAVAFTLLAPYARDLLEAIKDSPIGAPVRWFDDAMASVQEAIGGPPRNDIDGNDLKASIICAFKGGKESEIIQGRKSHFCTSTADEFNKDFEDAAKNGALERLVCTCAFVEASWSYPQLRGGSPAASAESDRMCEAFFKSNQYGDFQWKRGLNELMDVCSDIETNPDSVKDEGSSKQIKERCAALQAQIKKVEKAAKKPVEGIPKMKFGSCKCDAYNLSKYGSYCGNNCRAAYALGNVRLDISGKQPQKKQKPAEKKPDPSEDAEHQESVNKYCAEVREKVEAVSPETYEEIEDPTRLEKDIEEEDAATKLNEDVI
ncbi:Heat-labile enterotoxin IIA, A chain [Beauveria brongniartii RCEF 3172]|uniref:Heat-labile enterotoxin IIA, A chain n=1 Tax=Beauveria brongniartii RCEF 3172 TaxID=1081107 RepID=A0A166Y432_9HYPO|nr:Heat-labile enterotoxin IIA, A chain [Beauveria brongniartii RCEF 3172]